MTAASSKAVAAKAAADSAAEDLQGDTDDTAAVTQSQKPVDVAQQLQQAQQLAQQQAADFKQNNEGTSARLDSSTNSVASAGSTLGLSTGLSSAADPTALSADDATMDPAEKLQMAQQHHSQQAATFKQNSEGTDARLDTITSASNAGASAGVNPVTLDSAAASSVELEPWDKSSDADDQYVGVAAGDEFAGAGAAGSADATDSSYDTGLEGLGQTADAADAATSSSVGAKSINAGLSEATADDTATQGITDYAQYAATEDNVSEDVNEAATGGTTAEWAGSDAVTTGDNTEKAAQWSASDAAAVDASSYMSEMESTDTGATNGEYVPDMDATGAVSYGNDALVAQSHAAGQQQEQAASADQDPYTQAQTLPDSVSVNR